MFSRFNAYAGLLAAMLALAPSAAHAARGVPLIDAVKSGDVAAVRALLPGADVNTPQDDGTTALHWAVQTDNVALTPHLGSATRETRIAMGMLAVSALRNVLLEHRRPPNTVS